MRGDCADPIVGGTHDAALARELAGPNAATVLAAWRAGYDAATRRQIDWTTDDDEYHRAACGVEPGDLE